MLPASAGTTAAEVLVFFVYMGIGIWRQYQARGGTAGLIFRGLPFRNKADGGKKMHDMGPKIANPASVPCHYAPVGPWR